MLVLPVDYGFVKPLYHPAINGGRLWVSNQLPALSAALSAPPAPTQTAHLAATWRPAAGVHSATERRQCAAERIRRTCLTNLAPAWVILRLVRATPATFAGEARRALGVVPVCPEGGRHEVEPATDEARCSRHGSPLHPRQELAPSAPERLHEVSVSLRFTPEGLATRVATGP